MKLVEMLHLELEPVGIFFGNTTVVCDLAASPQKRNCVIPFVMSAAKGRVCSQSAHCYSPAFTPDQLFSAYPEMNSDHKLLRSHLHLDGRRIPWLQDHKYSWTGGHFHFLRQSCR